jgi:flagellar motor component MotA
VIVSLIANLDLGVIVLLVMVLVASVAAGSALMIVVSVLLLAIIAGLAYRAHVVERNLDRAEDGDRSE